MKEVKSLLDFSKGAIPERVQYELAKVLDNIQDPNTDEKPREITIKLVLTPDIDERKKVSIKAEISKKLRPTKPIQTAMQICAYKGENVGVELTANLDGQINLDGHAEERNIIRIFPQKAEKAI